MVCHYERRREPTVKAQQDIDGVTACENFILGFRLGVRMRIEYMDESDGEANALMGDS